jgi:hypothetical protein
MSARNDPNANTVVGPNVVMTASAGLTGLLIALVVAGSILMGSFDGSQRGAANGGTVGAGANADYGVRHLGEAAPLEQPAYLDYGLRHSATVSSASEQPYLDYGLRHPAQP